jgi:hypothetical protein
VKLILRFVFVVSLNSFLLQNLMAARPSGSPLRHTRETLINGPTSEVAGEMASNFLDDEANRRSIQ